ncbi:substrate-binding domain-containing protein [Parabacteroides sp. Marseille-P3160]|uniref:substrate-binding domain-containing protein n=1 Tax=Parabacteroides sp. Marseille-P3160 TaxID=1917887 RepID=UPI0009BB044E|nr:substrate-binding domain-containing protein [Parabacteroides sp. Marseille-P3160]
MTRTKGILFFLFLLFFLSGCSSPGKKKYVVGISQCMLDDAWRQAMIREMKIEATYYDDLDLIIKDANSNNDTQIEQIRELIRQKVDLIIISPFQSEPITAVAEEAYRSGIPTIITDRKVNTDQYTSFVGADNYDIGYAAGKYAERYLSSQKVSILEVWGMISSSPAQERHQGFMDALKQAKKEVVSQKVEGDWLYRVARKNLKEVQQVEQFDLVFSHNDMMAIAAREVFDSLDTRASKIPILGVDAVPGAGLEAVADGRINASFMYPTAGDVVLRTAMKILHGEKVPKEIKLYSSVVGIDFAKAMIQQSNQLLSYQTRIEQQKKTLDRLLHRFNFLQNSLFIILVLMVLLILLSVNVFYINWKIRRKNKELREKNRKEEEQRRKLVSLNAEIERVTAQQLQFFTNVSHELRTPLTLIIGPLDHLISAMSESSHLPDLLLMQKNANRLLLEINQLLDFRKIDTGQMNLRVHEVNIVAFCQEVKSYFESMARVRRIEYVFENRMALDTFWIDTDLIEKVLVNLLSNAFKYTAEGGWIRLRLEETTDQIQILVEDDGTGIPPEALPYLFDYFFTEKNRAGSGIGLHLVKEFVELHHGTVSVESELGKGTTFTVSLQKGHAHFPDEVLSKQMETSLSYVPSQLDDSTEKALLGQQYDETILLVEDDDEVRTYLQKELQENFHVLTALNGKEALELLDEKEVSLILSDVMMPQMNGFELCRQIKTNVSFSHLPVILLTALSDERQQHFGLSGGAEEYIQKPFYPALLKLKIIRLLEERKRLRAHLLQELHQGNLLLTVPEKAGGPENLFLHKFIRQIEEIYTDPDYNIEKLSDTLGLSRGHLYRKIKELTGTTPVDFLRNYRLGKAAQLIRQHTYSISEIAYMTGFSSPAYFSKCFKIVYGITPTEFQ